MIQFGLFTLFALKNQGFLHFIDHQVAFFDILVFQLELLLKAECSFRGFTNLCISFGEFLHPVLFINPLLINQTLKFINVLLVCLNRSCNGIF